MNSTQEKAAKALANNLSRAGGSLWGGVVTLGDDWQASLQVIATLAEAGALAGMGLKVKQGADVVDLLGVTITDLGSRLLYKPLTPERVELWEESITDTDKVKRHGMGKRAPIKEITTHGGTVFTFIYL